MRSLPPELRAATARRAPRRARPAGTAALVGLRAALLLTLVIVAALAAVATPAVAQPRRRPPAVATPATGDAGARRLARVLTAMSVRDAARILEQMDDRDARRVLAGLGAWRRAAILALLPPARAATLERPPVGTGADRAAPPATGTARLADAAADAPSGSPAAVPAGALPGAADAPAGARADTADAAPRPPSAAAHLAVRGPTGAAAPAAPARSGPAAPAAPMQRPRLDAAAWYVTPDGAYAPGRAGPHSGRVALSAPRLTPPPLRRLGLAFHAGAVRLAPDPRAVVAATAGLSLTLGDPDGLSVRPWVEALAGRATSAPDLGGWSVATPGGDSAYHPRRTLQRRAASGGGAGLHLAVPLGRAVAITATGGAYLVPAGPGEGSSSLLTGGLGLSLPAHRLAPWLAAPARRAR